MKYQLSWHTNQSLNPSLPTAQKESAKAKWQDRYRLSWHTNQSLNPYSPVDQRVDPANWQGKFNNFLHVTRARLMGSNEPQVWQSLNAAGHNTWNAYDANSERAIYQASEGELRAWLENLHYHV